MNIEEYEELIKNEEPLVSKILEEMENISKRFIDETVKISKEWIRHEVEMVVKSNSLQTTRLGLENIKNLQKDLLTLIDNLEIIADEKLNQDLLWIHRGHPKTTYFNTINDRYNYTKTDYGGYGADAINKGVGEVICSMNDLLKKYNYHNAMQLYHVSITSNKTVFSFNFCWNDEMIACLKDYNKHLSSLNTSQNKIRDYETKIADIKASDLWNQANSSC